MKILILTLSCSLISFFNLLGQIEKIDLSTSVIIQSSTEGNAGTELSVDGNYNVYSSSITNTTLNSSWEVSLDCVHKISRIKVTTDIDTGVYIVFSKDTINTYSYPTDGSYPPSIFHQNIDLSKSLFNNDNYYLYLHKNNLNQYIDFLEVEASNVSIIVLSNSSLNLIEVELWGNDDCEPSISNPNVFDIVDTEDCSDGIDNNNNLNVDCDDWECSVNNAIITYTKPSCPVCLDGEICIDANNVNSVSFDGGVNWQNFNDSKRNCFTLESDNYDIILKSPGGCTVNANVDLTVPQGGSNSVCFNGDFELGDFTNLTFATGLNVSNPPGPHVFNNFNRDPNVHNIISSNNFTDPIVGQFINNFGGLGDYFFKLGDWAVIDPNASMGGISQMEQLTYCFTVEDPNFNFIYARVLQDPQMVQGHTALSLPFFYWNIQDNSGNIITSTSSASNDPLLQTFGVVQGDLVLYLGWDCAEFDLSNYIGQNVCVNFVNSDCGRWLHPAYTYIDNICVSNELTPFSEIESCGTSFCDGQNINLTAKPGFYNRYSWEISKVNASGIDYDLWVSDEIIGVMATIDDLKDYYESNSQYSLECGVRVRVKLNMFNSCSSYTDVYEFDYYCNDYIINYCDPILHCSSNNLVSVIGENNCSNCTYEWTPSNRLINPQSPFPIINGRDYFDALSKTYSYKILTPEGCGYCGEVSVKPQGFDLELEELDIGHCSYNYSLNILLSDPISAIENSAIQVKIVNIVNGDQEITYPTGAGSVRNIYREQLRTSDTHFRIEVEINPTDCNDGNECRKTYTIDRINMTSYHAYWKATWPDLFTPNGDGVNDLFNFTFTALDMNQIPVDCNNENADKSSIYSLVVKIFDEWGNFIGELSETKSLYDTEGISGENLTWDGTFNGQPVDNGVYAVRVDVESCYDEDLECYNCGGQTDNFAYCFGVQDIDVVVIENNGNTFWPVGGITVAR